MKFRWLGNSCIELIGVKHLLIDPNYIVSPSGNPDYVLVTHEHSDHFSEKAKGLKSVFLAPSEAVKTFNIEAKIVKPGDRVENIEVVESYCYKSLGSVGYLIHDDVRVLHLGDSFKSPRVETDIAFLPTFKDYQSEIVKAAKNCKAKIVYPIHYSPEKKLWEAEALVNKLRREGIESEIMGIGEWIKI